jgi:2-hydroxychromene-2-carboxylate isomerase
VVAAPIEFYFDLLSPFGYLGSTQIERVAARHGRSVDWRPVLIGVTVLKVMGLKPVAETPLKGPYSKRDASRLAAWYDVPLRFHGLKGLNSVAASRAFLWIKQRDPDLAKRFAAGIYERLWVRGQDITPPEAAADEAAALGLDRAELLAALGTDEVKQALKDAVDAAIARGVFGVPFFIADDEPFWGCDHLPMLEHWLAHHSWTRPASGD